jgi:hypothetical protein
MSRVCPTDLIISHRGANICTLTESGEYYLIRVRDTSIGLRKFKTSQTMWKNQQLNKDLAIGHQGFVQSFFSLSSGVRRGISKIFKSPARPERNWPHLIRSVTGWRTRASVCKYSIQNTLSLSSNVVQFIIFEEPTVQDILYLHSVHSLLRPEIFWIISNFNVEFFLKGLKVYTMA